MPNTTDISGKFQVADILSSVVVFLVAIPLCLGIAIGSGADPAAGMMSGIIGGIIVGLLSGSPLQVSGPAAGLVVLTYQVIEKYGMSGLAVVLLIAGALQIGAGLLKLGSWFRAVTPAVVQGMLAGIGVLIFASQMHVMLADKPHKEGILNLRTIPSAILEAWSDQEPQLHWHSALVGIATLAVMIAWKKFIPKKFALIPPALVGVIVGALLVYFCGWQIKMVEVGNIGEKIQHPTFESWGFLSDSSIWIAGLGMGFVASAESLLCASAVVRLQKVPLPTDYNREIIAQGIGNTISGLVGGLPITGVIVRSAANVDAGAKSRFSSVLHGVFILGFVLLAPGVLNLIPIASLAAILVLTGLKLVNFAAMKNLLSYGRDNLLIYLVTLTTIVCTDLLIGVVVGCLLSAVLILFRFSNLNVNKDTVDGETHLHMQGAATFVSLPNLANELESIPDKTVLHVHLDELEFLDHACLELIMNWQKQHESRGGQLVIDWGAITAKMKGKTSTTSGSAV